MLNTIIISAINYNFMAKVKDGIKKERTEIIRMNFILTNDDGINAKGLLALYERFSGRHNVTVVAPDRERSAASHSITLLNPLRVSKVDLGDGKKGFAVDGKPADCVKFGILELAKERPDMVISGINPGGNVGRSMNYSGTLAAAKEASFYGIPAIAVSINAIHATTFEEVAIFMENFALDVIKTGLPPGIALNINFPPVPMEKIRGIKITRQNLGSIPKDYYERRNDPRGNTYYWLGYDFRDFGKDLDYDGDALMENYISITPVKCDMTDYEAIDIMKSRKFFQKFSGLSENSPQIGN